MVPSIRFGNWHGSCKLRRNPNQQPLGGDCCSLRRHARRHGQDRERQELPAGKPSDPWAGTRYYLDKVIVHSGYKKNARLQINDVALLKTKVSMGGAKLALNSDKSAPASDTLNRFTVSASE